jgi:heat shock protein HtpX
MLMPIAALFIQLAISRSREYLADETGAYYSNDPLALASALEKLHSSTRARNTEMKKNVNKISTAHMFIVKPFSSEGLISLFSTHPPIDKRIKKLHQIYEKKFEI